MRRLRQIREFMATEAAGGMVMITAAALAILLANSPLSASYNALLAYPILPHFSASLFVQDVLMVIFFFAVGLELKSEMREGALAAPGQKLLPLIAALGGVIAPALIYLLITRAAAPLQPGWAIPTATDIAFALCVLRLVGPSIPTSAKMFLLAIAIYDDLIAILIIALFYANGVALAPLAATAAISGVMLWLNHRHIHHAALYLALGVALWFAVHAAGIHPTVAGVITAFMIPLHTHDGRPIIAPLLHALHPYVAFLILPLFALVSAGVDLSGFTPDAMLSPLPLAIALALFFGKPIGILLATFACVRSGRATLPNGMRWRLVYGVSVIAGIGFTMSLFIGQLAFSDGLTQNEVKLGVLAGSLISAAWGLIFLKSRRIS